MPIRVIPECRYCGTAVEPTEPMGAWTHTGLSIWCPGSGQTKTATPIIRVEPLSKLGHLPLNEHGFPIYPKGTPIPEVKEFDRSQKVVIQCKNHPLSVWASKDPYVSRWFAARREYEQCDCPLAWYVLAEDYSPTRNG